MQAPAPLAPPPDVQANQEFWLGAPVRSFGGSFAAARSRLPTFARVPFSVVTPPEKARSANPAFDAVVRLPIAPDEAAVPVGIVSKSYMLVQHVEVFNLVEDALKAAGIDPARVKVTLRLTALGERMALQVIMPDEPKFRYGVGPNDTMGLQVFCLNSVEGSTRFVAVLGWLRFLCSNGLVIGASLSRLRRIHRPDLEMTEVRILIRNSLRIAAEQRTTLERWARTEVSDVALRAWVDGAVKKAWGVKAAVRAFHITARRHDVRLTDPFEKARPSQRTVVSTGLVPGALGGLTAFTAAQALTWLAGQRRDVGEQITWLSQVPALVNQVMQIRRRAR